MATHLWKRTSTELIGVKSHRNYIIHRTCVRCGLRREEIQANNRHLKSYYVNGEGIASRNPGACLGVSKHDNIYSLNNRGLKHGADDH